MSKEIKFEDALAKLEDIVNKMEMGELSLEESMKKYEEGTKLAELCGKKLSEAEKKVKILKSNKEDGPEWQDFEG